MDDFYQKISVFKGVFLKINENYFFSCSNLFLKRSDFI
jgi:hypothetical protein